MATQLPILPRFGHPIQDVVGEGVALSCCSSFTASSSPELEHSGRRELHHGSVTPLIDRNQAIIADAERDCFNFRTESGGMVQRRPDRIRTGASMLLPHVSANTMPEVFSDSNLHFGEIRHLFGRSSEVTSLECIYANSLRAGEPMGSSESAPLSASTCYSSDTLCRKQMVLIAGEPGSGKSRLALDTSRSACKRNGGFFLFGKFSNPAMLDSASESSLLTQDQALQEPMPEQHRNTSRPYSAIADACTSLIEDLLLVYYGDTTTSGHPDSVLVDDVEDDQEREHSFRWDFSSQSIREAWEKDDLQILIPIIQNIACLWGDKETNTDEYQNAESRTHHPVGQARSKQEIHYAFGRFFSILSELAPLFMLLDDLQWIDPASLELLEDILQNESLTRILVVGTIRNDEITNSTNRSTNMESLISKFSSLRRRAPSATVSFDLHEICIEYLIVSDVAEWLESLLGIPAQNLLPLAECVHERTAGNALYTKEFLLSLESSGLLTFDERLHYWRYDVDEIVDQTVVAQNVVGVVTKRMKCLPASEQAILPKIACIGFTFTFKMFQVLVDHSLGSDTVKGRGSVDDKCIAETLLKILQSEGIVTVDKKSLFIKWAHDKIREAALNLVNKNVVSILQFEIGKLLLEHRTTAGIGTSSELYIITNLLNSEADVLSEGHLRTEICRLNLLAGDTALQSSAYTSAKEFFLFGCKLLPEGNQKWATEYSELSLSLYAGAAEAHFCVGDHGLVAELFQEVKAMSNAPIVDKRRVFDANVNSMSAQGRTWDALQLTVDILRVLGCRFPRYSKSLQSFTAVMRLLSSVNKYTAKIESLPPMLDREKQWVIHLLSRMAVFTYQTDRHLLPLALIKGMTYTLQYGLAEDFAPILATIGLLLAAFHNDFKGGKQYADLALKCSTGKSKVQTCFIAHVFVLHYLNPFESCKKPLLESYKSGMKSGDLESGFWCILSFLELQLFTGAPLTDLLKECSLYCSQLIFHSQDKILWHTQMTFQLAFNLANPKSQRHILTGPMMNEFQFLECIKGKPQLIHEWVHLHRYKTYAAFWFGEHELVTQIIEVQKYHTYFLETFNPGFPGICPLYSYCALSSIFIYRKTGVRKHKIRALKFLKKLKLWVNKGNRNVHHSYVLVQAELASVAKISDAQEQYTMAILIAERWGFTGEQALGHEKLAEHSLRVGNLNDANYHYHRAIELYEDWGAFGKIEQLQEIIEAHPDLEMPVLSVSIAGTTLSPLSST